MAMPNLNFYSGKFWWQVKQNSIEELEKIDHLYSYLKNTGADEIIVRTTLVRGGWHDNEFNANAAGFNIYRFNNPDAEARHEFSEYYHFVRK